MNAPSLQERRRCPATGADCLSCGAGSCWLLGRRAPAAGKWDDCAHPAALLNREGGFRLAEIDPSIPAPRLAPVTLWDRLAAAARAWGWRGAFDDLVALVSLMALAWVATLILAAFGGGR